jgi:SAM-dependent methyltransferase
MRRSHRWEQDMTDLKSWDGTDQFRMRRYESYEQYVEHQAAKLRTLNLTKYNTLFKPALLERINGIAPLIKKPRGAGVLCLGARNGIECEAFIESGFFAVGIDLNPGEANPYVVKGDFHRLQFADGTVDVVFTNALDHAFNLERVIQEVRRVLKQDGVFIAEIVRGSKDEGGREPGAFESIWWDTVDTVADQIQKQGLRLFERRLFEYPWSGDQFVFLK